MAESTSPALRMAGGAGLERKVAQGAEESGSLPEPTLLARLLATRATLDSRAAREAEEERCEMQRLRAGQEELQAKLEQLIADKAGVQDYCTDLEELRASIKELRADFQEIRADKADARGPCTDFAQLRADVKDLWANFKRSRDDKADANDVRSDFAGMRADMQELHANLKELKAGKADTDDLRSDFVQLRADVKELHANLEELKAGKAETDDLRSDVVQLRADVKELAASFKDLRSDVDDVYTDYHELQADMKELKADFSTLVGCLERENPTIGQHLRRERAARAGACLDNVLTQPHLVVPILWCAGLRAWSAARRASKGVLSSCSSEGVQQEKLVVAFGYQGHNTTDADHILRSAEALDLQSWTWAALPDNYKRITHCGGVLAGCLYVCGGVGDLGHTVVRFNPARDPPRTRWELVASMSRARARAAAAVTRRYLYILGGESHSQVLNSTERFDPTAGIGSQHAWEMQPAMTSCRHNCAAVALREEILACGGYDRPAGQEELSSIDIAHSSEILSPGMQVWSPLASMTLPRVAHAAAAVHGRAVICGGLRVGTFEVLQSVEVFDPSSQSWAESRNMSLMRPRFNHAAVASAGGIYLLGGFRHDFPGAPAETSVEYLDFDAPACFELEPMRSSRACFTCGIIAMGPTGAGQP